MNLLHYLPYLLAFMAITAVLYAWGLYRAQTAARDDASLLKAKGVARIRRAVKKQGGCTRAQLREAVRDLSAGRPFSRGALPSRILTPFCRRFWATWWISGSSA